MWVRLCCKAWYLLQLGESCHPVGGHLLRVKILAMQVDVPMVCCGIKILEDIPMVITRWLLFKQTICWRINAKLNQDLWAQLKEVLEVLLLVYMTDMEVQKLPALSMNAYLDISRVCCSSLFTLQHNFVLIYISMLVLIRFLSFCGVTLILSYRGIFPFFLSIKITSIGKTLP